MNDNTGILGEILEQGVTTVKQAGQQIVKAPVDLAKAGAKQVKGLNQAQPSGESKVQEQTETKEFVKELYKPTENPKIVTQDQGKKPELTDEQKIAKLKQELHSQYYQDTFNRPKQQEERKAEKIEREEKEDRWDLQKKEEKKKPIISVQNAQNIEKHRGSSG